MAQALEAEVAGFGEYLIKETGVEDRDGGKILASVSTGNLGTSKQQGCPLGAAKHIRYHKVQDDLGFQQAASYFGSWAERADGQASLRTSPTSTACAPPGTFRLQDPARRVW